MNFSHAAVGTKDERQSEFDKMFRFHVMSKDSIVRDYEVSFEMPDGDIGSMYAIQAMTGTPAKMNPITTVIESHSTKYVLRTFFSFTPFFVCISSMNTTVAS